MPAFQQTTDTQQSIMPIHKKKTFYSWHHNHYCYRKYYFQSSFNMKIFQ